MLNKKERIVHAAVEVFREKGIEKTKISDIVKLAGIAQGTFYLYFPSKLSVMPAIAEVMVEKTIEEVKNRVDEHASFSVQLEQMVDAIFDVTRTYREVLAMVYAGLASSEQLKEWELVYEPFYSWMSGFLHKAKTEGTIRSTVNEVRISKLVIALVESAAEQIYLYNLKEDDQARVQKSEVHSFLEHALGVCE